MMTRCHHGNVECSRKTEIRESTADHQIEAENGGDLGGSGESQITVARIRRRHHKPVDLRRLGPSVRSAAGVGKIRWTFEPAARGWRVRAG